MTKKTYRLAIVDDNMTARANLRSHLLPFSCFDIYSYSNGNELRAAVKRLTFDIILLDYNLGQYKNGVECIQALTISGHVKPSTGIFFITADRLPKTIGQIMDLHPDVLIAKPYTMAALTRHIQHYLQVRELISDILIHMDKGAYDLALKEMKALLIEAQKPSSETHRYVQDLNKLFAKLLIKTGFYSSALAMYDAIIKRSDRVIWAQWGKIKCHYLMGEWSECEESLQHLVMENLTRDKAFEWLASLSIESQEYENATDYLDHINVSDLSTSATRLKSMAYIKQNKILDGLDLLQRQREHNRTVKALFDEFTYELAEFYISIAEGAPVAQRHESLSQARKLIGLAARGESDPQAKIKKDVLTAYTAVLEEDTERAEKLMLELPALALHNAPPNAMFCAAKIYDSLGDKETARTLLTKAENHIKRSEDQAWTSTMQIGLEESEKQVGVYQDKAMSLNEKGMLLFADGQYEQAMPLFYDAYQRVNTMPAFAINLLQSLVQGNKESYKNIKRDELLNKLETQPLNKSNQLRLSKIKSLLESKLVKSG